MKKILLVAAAALGLGGCATYGSPYGGSGVGVSLGYGGYGNTGYGGGYGYNQGYNNRCIAYDRYGRAYNACGGYGSYGSYGGSYGAYGYPHTAVVFSYPGYTYSNGYYYDRRGRRYDSRTLARRYGRERVYRHRRY
jgi:hypothetical protein